MTPCYAPAISERMLKLLSFALWMGFAALSAHVALAASDPLLDQMAGTWVGEGERIQAISGRHIQILEHTTAILQDGKLDSRNQVSETDMSTQQARTYERDYWVRPNPGQAGAYDFGAGANVTSQGHFEGGILEVEQNLGGNPAYLVRSRTQFDAQGSLYEETDWSGTVSLARPTSVITAENRPLKALTWMAASALTFSVMAVFVKRLAPVVPQFELVFFRSVVNLSWVFALMLLRKETFWPSDGKPLLVFRGLVGFAGVACMFYSISHLPLPIATMLNWCSPLFVIFFSRLALAERMPPLSAVWIPVAFAGLVLLLNPWSAQGGGVALKAAIIGLGAAFFGGLAYVAVRAATAKVGVNTIVFYFVTVSTLASAPLAASDFLRPSAEQWLELIFLGSFATLGQLTMTKAYQYAPAGVVSMMNLLNPVFGAAFGLFLFHERLAAFQWLGMALVGISLAGLTMRSGSLRKASSSLHG